jgi:ribosome-associated heat shock protein Hsp15
LWFARLTKSRSLAARLCAAGLVAVNGATVRKPSYTVRVGDIVVLPQGRVQRTARILAMGDRRGPAVEARCLYEETAASPIAELAPQWLPLLEETLDYASVHDRPGPMSK